jgi:hypothetical protein
MEDPVFRHKMCVSIAMVKCMFSNVGAPRRLTVKQVFDELYCSQYPEKYHFDLDHLKCAVSQKLFRKILMDFGFDYEDDQKPEARLMETMPALSRGLPKINNLCGN